jgi:methylmalonyl-CoA/ethylmalonyl-CoA epimerase
MLVRIEHLAVAVSDLESAIEHCIKVWGLRLEHREVVPDQGVEEAMFRLGDAYLQLVAPLSEDSTVSGFLAKRGEGLHHVAYEVADLEAALGSLRKSGVRLIDEPRRCGSSNTRSAFVHPKGNLGVLMELVEHAAGSGEPSLPGEEEIGE